MVIKYLFGYVSASIGTILHKLTHRTSYACPINDASFFAFLQEKRTLYWDIGVLFWMYVVF
jgi:hypothetical protein